MDIQDRLILNLLQKEGRCSYAVIGKQVGLSVTAIKDRIDKLQNAGILKNFSIDVDECKIGYSVLGFISVAIDRPEDCPVFEQAMQTLPQVQECHHITGGFNYLIKVVAKDMAALEELLSTRIKLAGIVGRTETAIVFSSPKKTSFVDCLLEGAQK